MMIFNGKNRVTQIYGGGHGGIDIVGDDSHDVHAVSAGTVDLVQIWDGKTKTGTQSYGHLLRVKKDNTYYYYAHMKNAPTFKVGDVITKGQIIGIMGSTGNSTGSHTHFEVRKGGKTTACRVNPAPYCGVENKKGTFTAAERTDLSADSVSQTTSKSYTQGEKIALNGVSLFVSSTAEKAAKTISGNYYIYDGKVINGRLRITNSAERCGKTPVGQNVTGWVNKEDI